jgi:hypothetical protein
VRRRAVLALIVGTTLALSGCGGGGDSGQASDAAKAASYARAEREMDQQAYDDALARMKKLDGYRDAAKRLREFKRRAARETLANAKKKLPQAPRAAVSLTKTSLKYHETAEARAFLKVANKAHDDFKRKQQKAGHF